MWCCGCYCWGWRKRLIVWSLFPSFNDHAIPRFLITRHGVQRPATKARGSTSSWWFSGMLELSQFVDWICWKFFCCIFTMVNHHLEDLFQKQFDMFFLFSAHVFVPTIFTNIVWVCNTILYLLWFPTQRGCWWHLAWTLLRDTQSMWRQGTRIATLMNGW